MPEWVQWLSACGLLTLISKFLYDFIIDLKEPTIDEVKTDLQEKAKLSGRVAEVEFRINNLEKEVNKKVEAEICRERSSKFEAFSKLHTQELQEIHRTISDLKKDFNGIISST